MPIINDRKLQDEFNLEGIDIPKEFQEPEFSAPLPRDPVEIIYKNLEKANKFLDKLWEKTVSEGIDSRMVEVAAKMVAEISIGAEKIFTNKLEYDRLFLKGKVVDLKQKELEIREKLGMISSGTPRNQNILITTDRESILKVLREKKQEETQNLIGREVQENDDGERLQTSDSITEVGGS